MKNKKNILQALNDLVETGEYVFGEYERGNEYKLTGDDYGFILSTKNILKNLFGEGNNPISDGLYNIELVAEGKRNYPIEYCLGALQAAIHAINNDYLQSQEILIAASVFDSTLIQAKELLEKKYKDPAAILARVVIEDSLRRLANNNAIAIKNEKGENKKASILNDELKKKEVYGQVQWRRIQTWLDIGNEAAHGNFDKVLERDVELLIRDVELFVEEYFGESRG